MLADGLVDELHLCIYPTVRGDGPRIYDGSPPLDLRLKRREQYENGVLYLVYAAPFEG